MLQRVVRLHKLICTSFRSEFCVFQFDNFESCIVTKEFYNLDAHPPLQKELVSVGLPVYNGAKSLRAAIEGLLAQTYQNIEFIISDNCSTDDTQKICVEFSARDKRIKYFRQAENIGAARNFRFVLEQARGKYFLWNAGDDTRSPDYVALNVAFLEANSDYCASTSRARDEGGKFNPRWMGDRSLDQKTYEGKILTYFKGWHRNSIFYSVYRREVIANIPILFGLSFLGHDWAVVMQTAKLGHFKRLEVGEMIIGTGGESSGIQHIRKMRKKPIEYLFPHWELCMFLRDISKDFTFSGRLKLLYRSLLLNISANIQRIIHVFEARH